MLFYRIINFRYPEPNIDAVELILVMTGLLAFILLVSKIVIKGKLYFPNIENTSLKNYTFSFYKNEKHVFKEQKGVSLITKALIFLMVLALIFVPLSDLLKPI